MTSEVWRKALIIQQLAWATRVGHGIARTLHSQGCTLAAVVHGVEAYRTLRSQSEVPYAEVYFADPLYDQGSERILPVQIREIENRYRLPSIWRLVYADRMLALTFQSSRTFLHRKPVSNDYLLSVSWAAYQFVRGIMDEVEPGFVLAPNIGSLVNYLFHLESQVRNVPFLTVGFSRFKNYFYVADGQYFHSSAVRARFSGLRSRPEDSPRYEEAKSIYMDIRASEAAMRPRNVSRTLSPRHWSAARVGRTTLNVLLFIPRISLATMLFRRVMGIRNIWTPGNSRWNGIRTRWTTLREQFLATDYQRPCIRRLNDVSFDYVYYPLHVEPELNLLVFAPEHANQVEVCRRIAISLPQGVRLLVKEHPNMVPARSRAFYQDLKGLVNVELIHSSAPSHEIFTSGRCRAVLSVFSTVGFEAAMSGVPVVTLAPTEYADLPTVQYTPSLDAAVSRLRQLLSGEVKHDAAEIDRGNVAYLSALLEESLALDYVERWNLGEGHIDAEALVGAIFRRVTEGGARRPAGVEASTPHCDCG